MIKAIELGIALGTVVLLCLGRVLFGHWLDYRSRLAPQEGRQTGIDALRRIARSGRMEHIGALVDALDRTAPPLRSVIIGRLTRRLERFKPMHASLLTDAQCEQLYRLLTWGERRRLLRAILKMAETLEDTNALPYVERFVHQAPDTRQTESLRASAEACRVHLTRVANTARERRILLRPTSAPTDSLLRPAQSASEADPQ